MKTSIAYTYLILVAKAFRFSKPKQVTINDFDFCKSLWFCGTYNNTVQDLNSSGYKANTILTFTILPCSMELSDNAKVFIDGTKIMDVTHNSGGGIDECTASLVHLTRLTTGNF